MRKSDDRFKRFNRTDRFYQNDTGWFFMIRQGAMFGPYENRTSAEKGLHSFVSLLKA